MDPTTLKEKKELPLYPGEGPFQKRTPALTGLIP